MSIKHDPSPNFNERQKKLKYLILHYTGTENTQKSLEFLKGLNPDHQVSIHYFVDEEGSVTSMVDEEMRAWHAGISCWEGEYSLNCSSIGVEIQNPGHDHGYRDFPDTQIKSVINLCQNIIERHNFLPHNILAHSDIAPDRKKDPGELFPWELLAEQHVGIWPVIDEIDINEAEEILQSPEQVKLALVRYGYNHEHDLKTLLTAFQRHFEPEIFATPDKIGIASINTISTLLALIRQKKHHSGA